MDNTILCQSGQFLTGHTFHCFRAPIGTYVRENLCTVSQQMAEEHSYSVAGIIFSSQYVSFTNTVPVERSIQQGFREVTVRVEVRPLTLSLETSRNSIVTKCFFLESHFLQLRITFHQVAHDNGHLHNEIPVGIFFRTCLSLGFYIEILSFVFLAIFFSPSHRFGVFFLIVNSFRHTANDFRQIYRLTAHTQIFLEEIRIYN